MEIYVFTNFFFFIHKLFVSVYDPCDPAHKKQADMSPCLQSHIRFGFYSHSLYNS